MSSSALIMAMAILPKLTGFLSLLGSSYVIHDIVTSKPKRAKLVNRIMLGLSGSDCVYSSMVFFLSTWPVPRSTPSNLVYGAVGNHVTCQLQGFVDQWSGRSSYAYNLLLALQYLAVVRYQWSEECLGKWEPLIHVLPFTLGCSTAVIILLQNQINFTGGYTCYISEYPLNCSKENSNVPCERGINFQLYRFWLNLVPLWTVGVVITVAMFLIFWTVFQTEQKSDQYLKNALAKQNQPQHQQPTAPPEEDVPTMDATVTTTNGNMNNNTEKNFDNEINNNNNSNNNNNNEESNNNNSNNDKNNKRNNNNNIKNKMTSVLFVSPPKLGKRSKQVAIQGLLFSSAFFVSWMPTIILSIEFMINQGANPSGPTLFIIEAIVLPLQGFWNFCIYIRPRIVQQCHNHPEQSVWNAITETLFGWKSPPTKHNKNNHKERTTPAVTEEGPAGAALV